MADSMASQEHCWRSPHGRALPVAGGRTLIMGAINVTPDSFSEEGKMPTIQTVLNQAGAMLAAGADVLDIGGESSRPGAQPVSLDEERARVLPAVDALRHTFLSTPISIDTYKPEIAAEAIQAGADIINDIWGGMAGFTIQQRSAEIQRWQRGEPAQLRSPMAETAAKLGCPLILMHNRPDREYTDFWTEVVADLRLIVAVAEAAGVPRAQLWLDPGFGFAKTPAQNLEVLKGLGRIVALGYPVLLGTSRKSTIGLVLDAPVNDRLDGTGATLTWGIQQGCQMVRVHDVAAMRRYVRMADAIRAGLGWKE